MVKMQLESNKGNTSKKQLFQPSITLKIQNYTCADPTESVKIATPSEFFIIDEGVEKISEFSSPNDRL